jgi:hypothetical protein
MLILHPYTSTRLEDQKDTIKGLKEIRKHYEVLDWLCVGPVDYDIMLKAIWNQDDLIVIEQDNGCNLKLVEELIACPEPWCVHWYYQYYKDMKGDKIRSEYFDEKGKKTVDKTQGYRIISGLGFSKIVKEVQEYVDSEIWFLQGDWVNLDARVAMSIRGMLHINPHAHSMCAHHHKVNWMSDRHNVPFEGLNCLFQIAVQPKLVTITSNQPSEIMPHMLTVHKNENPNITVNWVDGKGKPIDPDKPIIMRRKEE